MDQSSPSFFENEQLSFTIEHAPDCEVIFRATLTSSFIKMHRKEAVQKTAKEVNIPGFRKGSASEQLIMHNAPAAFRKNLEQVLASQAYQACQKLHFVPPFEQSPKITFHCDSLSDESGVFTIRFETLPQIPVIDPSSLTPPPQATAEVDIAKEIESIKKWFVTHEVVESRSLAEGDFAKVTLHDIEQEPHAVVFNEEVFEIAKGKHADWFVEALIGMEPGQSKTVVSKPDAQAKDASEFKEKNVQISLINILKEKLPSDEELAKKLGVENPSDLPEKVKALVEKRNSLLQISERRDFVSKQILEKYICQIPKSLIERELSFRIREDFKDEKARNAFLAKDKQEQQAIIDGLKKSSHLAISLHCLCLKYTEANKLEVEEDILVSLDPAQSMFKAANRENDESTKNREFSRDLLATTLDHICETLKTKA